MELAERVQAIKVRLETLHDLAAKLNETIVQEKANDRLLGHAKHKLLSVETELVPWALKAQSPKNESMYLHMAEFELSQVEAELRHAQEMVKTYGSDIQAIGG